jgi:hypothetical protein
MCAAGFEVNPANGRCTPCPPGTFKPNTGNSSCRQCGDGGGEWALGSGEGALFCTLCKRCDAKATEAGNCSGGCSMCPDKSGDQAAIYTLIYT